MLTKWMTILLGGGQIAGVIIPFLGFSIICMLRGNFDTSTWYFPLALDPNLIDPSTVLGWYLRTFDYIWACCAYCMTALTV